jgi:hypothetical protein
MKYSITLLAMFFLSSCASDSNNDCRYSEKEFKELKEATSKLNTKMEQAESTLNAISSYQEIEIVLYKHEKKIISCMVESSEKKGSREPWLSINSTLVLIRSGNIASELPAENAAEEERKLMQLKSIATTANNTVNSIKF